MNKVCNKHCKKTFGLTQKSSIISLGLNIEYQFDLPDCRDEGINDRNENDQEEEDDDENVYAVQPVDDDDKEVENQDENENALINPGNEVEDPVWPVLIGRTVFRAIRRRRRRRRRRGGRRRRRRGRRWG